MSNLLHALRQMGQPERMSIIAGRTSALKARSHELDCRQIEAAWREAGWPNVRASWDSERGRIVTNLAPEIDVVVSGHTHTAYNCEIAGKVVTSAASFGRLITDIDLEISALTGDVTAVTAANVIVTRDQADPEIAAFVADYKDLAAPLANAPIGTITGTLERYAPMMKPGLSTMGAVIADAQLAATSDVMLGGSEVAFMNPGGVRAVGGAASIATETGAPAPPRG